MHGYGCCTGCIRFGYVGPTVTTMLTTLRVTLRVGYHTVVPVGRTAVTLYGQFLHCPLTGWPRVVRKHLAG